MNTEALRKKYRKGYSPNNFAIHSLCNEVDRLKRNEKILRHMVCQLKDMARLAPHKEAA